jgi:hypothetical protein
MLFAFSKSNTTLSAERHPERYSGRDFGTFAGTTLQIEVLRPVVDLSTMRNNDSARKAW